LWGTGKVAATRSFNYHYPSTPPHMTDIKELNEKIQRESAFVDLLQMEVGKIIIGQKYMVERLLIGLLSNGHVLLEGVPGLAKTLSIKSLAQAVNARFN